MEPLTVEVMVNAYASGYFPMADPEEDDRIYWYKPEVRALLPLDEFHVPRRLARTMRQGRFQLRLDHDFEGVIRGCADRQETWLSEEIIQVFLKLHAAGVAHAMGAYRSGTLVGGVYGLALGSAFFAESMFQTERDASKVALAGLVERLDGAGFTLFDVQFASDHLKQFGLVEIPEDAYEVRLMSALGLSEELGDSSVIQPGQDTNR